jgi:catechol 2,3-dioxygenase-like lactoylglutathione lyase family enzyme
MKNPETYGLTHLAIRVRDIKRTLAFYREVFDAQVMYEEKTWAQITTPSSHDVIVFEQSDEDSIGKTGGIVHFGYRLREPGHITEMVRRVTQARRKDQRTGRVRARITLCLFFRS